MTYFTAWLTIIASVVITLTAGYLLNHYALRRHRVAVRHSDAKATSVCHEE